MRSPDTIQTPGRAREARAVASVAAVVAASLLAPMQISAHSAPGVAGRGHVPSGPVRGAAAHSSAAGTGPCAGGDPRLRCPDLIMSAPRELELDRSTIPGRVLLRATSSVDSRGAGPLELRAHRSGRHGTVVYQVIYARHGRARVLRTRARLTFKHIPGARYGYGDVGAASYWKLRHAAAFQLWSVGPGNRAIALVRSGPKVDYCLRDLLRTQPSPRSPGEAVYPACSQDPGMRRDVLGTSVGWSDVYPNSYPEQWIDVTGLRGRFAYVQIADPDDLLYESDKRDNLSETYIELPSARVLGSRVGVAQP